MEIRCGIDILEVKRIENLKNKKRFLERIFLEEEISYIRKKSFRSETVAGMFAGKEAVAKALKTGIGPISFKDIEITREGGISVRLNPDISSNIISIDLSISHDKGLAIAMCSMIIGDENED